RNKQSNQGLVPDSHPSAVLTHSKQVNSPRFACGAHFLPDAAEKLCRGQRGLLDANPRRVRLVHMPPVPTQLLKALEVIKMNLLRKFPISKRLWLIPVVAIAMLFTLGLVMIQQV